MQYRFIHGFLMKIKGVSCRNGMNLINEVKKEDYNMIKKLGSLALTLCLTITMLSGYTCPKTAAAREKKTEEVSGFSFKKTRLPFTSEKQKYMIVTKDRQKADRISETYKPGKQSRFSRLAKAENIVSVKITGKQANEIQKDAGVLCIEPDGNVKGCAEEEAPGQITEENQKTWNQEMLHIPEEKEEGAAKVKVAVLDSGIDYGNDIVYKEQINLIPGEEELTPFFTDATGHGTSVAGIICAEDNGAGITGMNPHVELYSAKVLSEGNKAPVSRVVEGIYWAIENKVHILNMSFSTPDDSQILRKAVEDAYQAGILMVAAAGNNGQVEYPAAYPQVIAVGSVNAEGKAAEKSASGDELEFVAPGEKVTSTGLLHGTIVQSGTSLAAPHVAGVASLLWQKDITVTADFIRGLLKESANPCGDAEQYGEGLVDYEYALSIYDTYKEDYEAGQDGSISEIPENPNPVPVYEENSAVEGQWADHAGKAKDAGAIAAFQNGAAAPDKESSGLKDLGTHHPWHGGRFANYAADYRYVVKVANAVHDLDASATKAKIVQKIESVGSMSGMDGGDVNKTDTQMSLYKNGIFKQMKQELCDNIAPVLVGMTSNQKRAYVFGIASHIATDAFAHASYRYNGTKWVHIDHVHGDWCHADNEHCVARRILSAKAVLTKIIDRFNGNRSDIAMVRDFLISKTTVAGNLRQYYNSQIIKFTQDVQNEDATYRMHKMRKYFDAAGESDSDVLKVYGEVSCDG